MPKIFPKYGQDIPKILSNLKKSPTDSNMDRRDDSASKNSIDMPCGVGVPCESEGLLLAGVAGLVMGENVARADEGLSVALRST